MNFWKLSAGTAGLIGQKPVKTDAPPTTGYIMLGEKCGNNCRFCSQSRQSQAKDNLLSRITWPAVPAAEAASGIAAAYAAGRIKRACLQVVHSGDSCAAAARAVADLALAGAGSVPVCVSSHLETVEQAERLMAAGADRICIALDAATPAVYRDAKEGDWLSKWDLLIRCAARFSGRVTTHLIVGLGETEAEMADVLAACVQQRITVGLFAFTPIRGTAWSGRTPPAIGSYRRIQVAHYLLQTGYGREIIRCEQGRISGFNLPALTEFLADGRAFQTSGCPDCNRPYYNERPGGTMYNYPRPLRPDEVRRAVWECEVEVT
ncbi:radical SAM protein [Acetonema longum]|uniref:Radical SAM domain protein n=1 Tax=Acetonema longum DSM 6540 TaxID=1009370 RepID=F7NPI0_9FIRM|nr:radical SAM protein [Acetonema longum]EGO62060.1 Radical SAM domain protein [Acetonema longum DSM 6540]